METRNIHSLPFQAREAFRREAIKAILDGETQTELAKVFGVTRQAVCKWVKAYRAMGEEGLRARKTGRPKKALLLPLQTMQIITLVADNYPEQLGLPFYLWTREAVAQLIEQRFGVRFSIQTVGRYLGDWGFIPQRPLCWALEKKPEKVCHWLEKEYPKIQIFDGNPVYRARKIEILGRSSLLHTHLFFLPGHSPQVDPKESLNREFEGVVESPLFMGKLGLIANVPGI